MSFPIHPRVLGPGSVASRAGQGPGLSGNFDYNNAMARPPKEPRLRMDTDIRIPVTADQKRLIAAAVADEPGGLAAWARQVLLQAAGERAASRKQTGPEGDAAEMKEFLGEVYRLSRSGSIHAAGDLIFDFVHGLMRSRDFAACDRLLMAVEPDELQPALMITFLSTTLTARPKLRARDDYFSRVVDALTRERGPVRAAKLLDKYR
jgi:hypothetical protein